MLSLSAKYNNVTIFRIYIFINFLVAILTMTINSVYWSVK